MLKSHKFTFDTFSFGASRRSCLLYFWQRFIQVLQKPTNLSFVAKHHGFLAAQTKPQLSPNSYSFRVLL